MRSGEHTGAGERAVRADSPCLAAPAGVCGAASHPRTHC